MNTAVLELKPRPVPAEAPDHPLNDLQRTMIPALAHSVVKGERGSAAHRQLADELAGKRTWAERAEVGAAGGAGEGHGASRRLSPSAYR